MSGLLSPEGGWRVRILDLSGGVPGAVIEEIAGFTTLMQANEFARRYLRDSIERCRTGGMSAREVLDAWFAWGEDVEIVEPSEGGWRSANELADFAAEPASEAERDWRALDPRRAVRE